MRLRHTVAFRADPGGNATLILALAVIPLFGAAAVAVDDSRGNSARTAMQVVLDAILTPSGMTDVTIGMK